MQVFPTSRPVFVNTSTVKISFKTKKVLSKFYDSPCYDEYLKKKLGTYILLFNRKVCVEMDIFFNRVCAKVMIREKTNVNTIRNIIESIIIHICRKIRRECNNDINIANNTKTIVYIYIPTNGLYRSYLSNLDLEFSRYTFVNINDDPLGKMYDEHIKPLIFDEHWNTQRIYPPGLQYLYSPWKSCLFDMLNSSLVNDKHTKKYNQASVLQPIPKYVIKANKSL